VIRVTHMNNPEATGHSCERPTTCTTVANGTATDTPPLSNTPFQGSRQSITPAQPVPCMRQAQWRVVYKQRHTIKTAITCPFCRLLHTRILQHQRHRQSVVIFTVLDRLHRRPTTMSESAAGMSEGTVRVTITPMLEDGEIPTAAAAAAAPSLVPDQPSAVSAMSEDKLKSLLGEAVQPALASMSAQIKSIASHVHVMSEVKARESDLSAVTSSADRAVQFRIIEYKLTHHGLAKAITNLQWTKSQMGPGFSPQLMEVEADLDSLMRMTVMHLGALELVTSRGWGVYNAYTAAMRPYAANPPPKWIGYDWRCDPTFGPTFGVNFLHPLASF
jgi:hypothetical protein